MTLTRRQKYGLAGGVIAAGLLAWWLWPKAKGKPPGGSARVAKTLEIDSNVMSPTFGLPIGTPSVVGTSTGPEFGPPTSLMAPVADSPEMQALIDQSNAAIEAANAE
jgi:hypothetical protein